MKSTNIRGQDLLCIDFNQSNFKFQLTDVNLETRTTIWKLIVDCKTLAEKTIPCHVYPIGKQPLLTLMIT